VPPAPDDRWLGHITDAPGWANRDEESYSQRPKEQGGSVVRLALSDAQIDASGIAQ
jgi:hypothetical protein